MIYQVKWKFLLIKSVISLGRKDRNFGSNFVIFHQFLFSKFSPKTLKIEISIFYFFQRSSLNIVLWYFLILDPKYHTKNFYFLGWIWFFKIFVEFISKIFYKKFLIIFCFRGVVLSNSIEFYSFSILEWVPGWNFAEKQLLKISFIEKIYDPASRYKNKVYLKFQKNKIICICGEDDHLFFWSHVDNWQMTVRLL